MAYDEEMGTNLIEGGFQGPLEEGKEWDSLNPPMEIDYVPPRPIDPYNPNMSPMPARPQGPEGGYGTPPPERPYIDSRTWPVQTPNFINPETFPQVTAPPEDQYSLAEKLLYGLQQLGGRAGKGFSQAREGIGNYLQKNMPKIYRNRYAYQGDEPVRGPEGGRMFERQQVGFQNPFTASRIDPTADRMGDYNWLERALMLDMEMRSPVREIGDPMISYDFSDKE